MPFRPVHGLKYGMRTIPGHHALNYAEISKFSLLLLIRATQDNFLMTTPTHVLMGLGHYLHPPRIRDFNTDRQLDFELWLIPAWRALHCTVKVFKTVRVTFRQTPS